VARLGVHSVLSLPLVTPDGVFGAMNVYAHAKGAFDEHSVNVGELFSVPAAIAVQNAQVLAQAKRLATNLQAALTSRAVIDQAMGIVMSRTGCSAAEAFERLKARSQTEHIKVSAVAQSVVDAAVRRARSRRSPDDPPPPAQ
jgi:transcriptional regulator with GAF, ATPase, and Fis domain